MTTESNLPRPRADFARRLLLILTFGAAALIAGAGCNFGSGGPATPTPTDGITIFGQAILSLDGEPDAYPGYANYWDLDTDFSIASGGRGQFDYALALSVGGTPFPTNQAYSGLTYAPPALGTADGLAIAIIYNAATTGWPVYGGVYSLAMQATRNSRVLQTLDLTGAVAPITLDFDGTNSISPSNFSNEPYFYQVVVRSTANGLLGTLYYRGDGPNIGGSPPYDLSAYAGQIVQLSFESRMTPYSTALIDDVSVTDDNATEFVTNGGFETGNLSGWSRTTPSFHRNVTTASRTLAGLGVTRSFFTTPMSLWGRSVDVFTNTTGATINTTASYEIDLASNGTGVIYDTPNTGAPAEAVTTWDGGTNGIRDVGWVFGSATSVTYTSDDAIDGGNGDDRIIVTYDLSVAPGASVTLVNYLILSGANTGQSATDVGDFAVTVDDEAEAIYTGYGVDADYTEGMTQPQIDTVANF